MLHVAGIKDTSPQHLAAVDYWYALNPLNTKIMCECRVIIIIQMTMNVSCDLASFNHDAMDLIKECRLHVSVIIFKSGSVCVYT